MSRDNFILGKSIWVADLEIGVKTSIPFDQMTNDFKVRCKKYALSSGKKFRLTAGYITRTH